MRGRVLWLAVSLIAVSCAKPTYVNKIAQPLGLSSQMLGECSLSLKDSYCLEVNWLEEPAENKFARFALKTYRLNKLDKSKVYENYFVESPSIELWMPDMGHGSSPVSVEKIDSGTYLVSDVYFSMHGDWQIKISSLNGENKIEEFILPYSY